MNNARAKLEEYSIMLCLTERCNLSCIYCYEKNKSQKRMTFEVAKTIIDNELHNKDRIDRISIDFFGGEPFLGFDCLKQTVEYIHSTYSDYNLVMFTTTNGTLVHGDIQEWLIKHKDHFICGLSLDGKEKSHNLNRPNSFKNIDLDFFRKMYPEQGVKMTISNLTLPYLYTDVVYLHDSGFLVNCNLAYGIDWSNAENCVILERELKKLINYYLENPKIVPCSLVDTSIKQVGYANTSNRKWCGAGTHVHAYDTEGYLYPCQFFLPVTVGTDKVEETRHIAIPSNIPAELEQEDCRLCSVKAVCPTCYGSNYASTGNLFKRDSNLCRLTKIILKARSYYYANLWKRDRLNLSKEEEQALLRSITIIQNLKL